MGNVEITLKSRRGEDAKIAEGDSYAGMAARLLGVNEGMLTKWIVHRKIQTGKEVRGKIEEKGVRFCSRSFSLQSSKEARTSLCHCYP